MNLQIRDMFSIEPTSAELASSRKHFAKRPFLQWNAQPFRTPPCGSAGHSRHERPTTHIPAPEGLPRKTAATIHSRMAGCRIPPKVRQPTIFESSTLVQQTTLQRSSSTRVHAQSLSHNVGSSRRIQKPPCTKKIPCDPCARFDHTDAPHTRPVSHGDLHPMLPTKHMAGQ